MWKIITLTQLSGFVKCKSLLYECVELSFHCIININHMSDERGRCEDRPEASEEVSTSKCLSTINVFADPMLDDQNRQYVVSVTFMGNDSG